ncbi:unnamed protein product [Prorocentrum cordatum]|uniref:C3H1-type domain-containing protein n=1 Tax=Prorocentrum cordatum TaxID=2364126 RepID=A0ABN9W8L4_9DINO|nr:unnamed protein product [Polarella glacialis]
MGEGQVRAQGGPGLERQDAAHLAQPPPQFPPRPPGILASALGQQEQRREAHVLVKNTFINVSEDDDEDEQPSYRPCASAPASSLRRPRGAAAARGTAAAAAGRAAAAPAGVAASVGSSGHPGNCRPCAHAWKPAGCSKGLACTFCHACTEEDFKDPPRGAEGEDQQAEGAEGAAAGGHGRRHARRVRGGLQRLGRLGGSAVSFALPKELMAVSDGAGWSVQWAVDLHRLCTKNRCGDAKGFTLPLHGRQVQFRFFLKPAEQSDAGGGKASFCKDSQLASVMLKCTDTGAVQPGARVSVAFTVGALPRRWASQGHDFATEPCCALHEREPPWDLAAAADGAGRCVLRAVVTPVPEQ